MKYRDAIRGIILSYNEDEAVLTITDGGMSAEYDETECDTLLRLLEHSNSPMEDLAEFFAEEFTITGYYIAEAFASCSDELEKLVYA